MQLSFLNSPKRIVIFGCVVGLLAFSIIWLTSYIQNAEGLPRVEAAVDRQLSDLVASSSPLKKVEFIRRGHVHTVKSDDQYSGYFEYDARMNGRSAELRVDWVDDKAGCRVTQISSVNNEGETVVLWRYGH